MIALAGNFIPNLLGLICIALAFKYAALGGLNQGILPTLTSLAGVYSAILFYFTFGEAISCAQIIGMLLMLICVVFLGLESASVKTDMSEILNISESDKKHNAIIAIVWALISPTFYTLKAYIIRKYCDGYKPWDLGIDAIYLEGFNFEEFLYGQIVSILYLIGK